MRHVVHFLFLILFIFSCGKINEKVALDEIRTLEYTRDADSQKLVSFLNHRNPRIRLAAVVALGRIQDSSKTHLLANRLVDENAEIRKAAAFALGQLFSPVAESHLLEANRSESLKEVRAEIVRAWGKSGTEKCFNPLKDYLESSDSLYQGPAALACGILAFRGNPPFGNAFHLEVLLNNAQSSQVRWQAAYSLFRLGNPSSFKNIYDALKKEQKPLVKHYALRALGAIIAVLNSSQFQEYRNHPQVREIMQLSGSQEFRQSLIKFLQDEDWSVRMAAVRLAGHLAQRSLYNEVMAAAKDDHPYVKIEAIQALASFNSPATRRELSNIYHSNDPLQIRGEALLTLTELDARNALALIEADLAASSPDEQEAFARNYYLIKALEMIDGKEYRPKATQQLIQLASSGPLSQQTLALEALANRTEVPLEFMLEKLSVADPAMTTVVATHLSIRKSPQAVEPLIEAYSNFEAPRDLEAMTAIIVALDSIGSSRAVPFLEEQLSHPFPPIQRQARQALVDITGASDIEISQLPQDSLTKWDFEPGNFSNPPRVAIETTRGRIVMELYPDKAPVTVANFLSLVQQDFYDSVYFHRVVPGFVVQGGDPRGDGWGGPGYSIPCEYNDMIFSRGAVGMAHAGKDTGGSQFFITHLPQPHLDGRYTAFGKVIEGMEVVDNILMFDQIISCTLINNPTQN